MSTVIITDSATLRVLDVSRNNISDDGIAVISEALQHNKSLTTLRVRICGLSVKGTVVCVFKLYLLPSSNDIQPSTLLSNQLSSALISSGH